MTLDGWRWLTIRELGNGNPDVVQTGPFGAQLHSADYTSEGVPFILIKNITEAGVDMSNMPRISVADARRLEKYSLRNGDIVFSRVGRVGSCFMATGEHSGWIISGQLLRIRLPSTEICAPFLVCALRGDSAQDFIRGRSIGSTRKSINTRILSALRVPVPPFPEQRKIAAILSSVDDAIEKTQAVIDQVQVVKRGLMQELLTRGLPGRHTQFKRTEISEIPEEWDLLPLAALAQDDRGLQTGPFGSQLHASDYVAAGVPVLMPKDMMNGYASDANSARISEEKAEELSQHKVQEEDILFARRGELGRVGLVTKLQEGWLCGTGCLRFRPSDRAVSRYLRQWVAWPTSARWLNEHGVGQTMLNLNTSILGRLPVALPDDTERSAIVEVLEAFERQIRSLKENVGGLGQAKRSLMSVLLTGELRVTPDTEAA